MMGVLGKRAVVAGGSMAGMLAARVLSEFFTEVIVLDRDNISDQPADRPMTPQSVHVHILLKGGELALNRLFPGISGELAECGSVQINLSQEMINANPMGSVEPWEAGITLQSQSRALLEHHVRKRVSAYSENIKFIYRCTVRGLLYDEQQNRITGVEIDNVDGQRNSIMADLVVDASGRGAGGVRWLSALKLEIPRVQEVKVDFGYSSCKLKLRDSAKRDWNGVLCGGLPPDGVRGSLMLPIEDGMHICSAGGRFGDFPPNDEAGFRDFVENLGADAMHEAIQDAEVVSPFASIRYEYNRFRHYEELKNLPRGFLVIGDALCSVNPTYGQGMSSATLQVKELAEILGSLDAEQGTDRIAELFFPRAVNVAAVIWRQANFNDFAYPKTEGDRTMFSEEEVAYNMALQMLAIRDLDVRRTLVHVNHFVVEPSALRSDEIMQKVEALKTAAA